QAYGETPGTWHGVAGHGHTPVVVECIQFCGVDRRKTGTQNRLHRRDCLQERLYHRTPGGRTRQTPGKEFIRPLPHKVDHREKSRKGLIMDRVHVLVTGSNGQLGNELQRLAAHDSAIRYTFVDADEMDLTRSDDIHEYFSQKQFDFIVNTAAYTDVDGAESNEDLAFAVNERAVAHLGEICLKSKTRLIHISTDYVFDGHAFRPLDELAEPNPLSVYGRSKLGGEKAVLSTLPDAYIVRTSWLYSSYGKNFVKTILRLAA